ncbi:MAG: hypothetical protein KH319_02520 [Butyricicoccus pullicaecorum]|nr:hypothetical protein [Butyricicoccus pullicaecorum]
MKRKLKRAGMIAGVLAVAALMFFFPRPIVPDIEDTRVISVYYNPYFMENSNEIPVSIPDFDEQKILECLSRYRKYYTLSRAGQRSVSDIQLEIGILTNDDTHQTITLGNIHNDIAESYGAWKQGVYNADALREELLDILELPE